MNFMENSPGKRFSFSSDALPAETFGVVRFSGEEGLSFCYRLEVVLVSREAEIDIRGVMTNPVRLGILRSDGEEVVFHGIPVSFEQMQQVGEHVFYRAVMSPKLWWLSLTRHNQVFLDKSVPEILEACMKDGGLTSLDYELRLQREYPAWEYVCQYGESHLDFVSRWMEREGMYYYFEQGTAGEKVIVTDTKIAHTAMAQGRRLRYLPPTGLEAMHREEVVRTFFCRQRMLPRSVILKEYNYRNPSMDLTARAEVYAGGRGEVYLYGEHFRTPEEGNALAKIRAEEILCGERRFDGESSVPYLRPGYTFELTDHYRGDFNSGYMTVHLVHEGSQAGYMLSGLGEVASEGEKETYYRNSFAAVPADVQFRPERRTVKPRFSGTIPAKIDGAGSGQYAELDEQGRYKVALPFDRSERMGGKASAWVRMMQPYAGADHGMHFPLHKGTEVLLSFVDGDPDRPIIAGAVPNPETPSPVTSENATRCRMVSGSGNEIHMEDEEGSERILMHAPAKESFIRIGAPNDPLIDWDKLASKDGIAIATWGPFNVTAKVYNALILGESSNAVLGMDTKFVGGIRTDSTVGARFNFPIGGENKAGPLSLQWVGIRERAHAQDVITEGNKVNVLAAVSKVVGDKVQAGDLESKMTALKNEIMAEYTKAIANQTKAMATKNELATSMQEVTGAATTAAESSAQTAATRIKTVALSAQAAAVQSKLAANSVQATLEDIKTSISDSKAMVDQACMDALNAKM